MTKAILFYRNSLLTKLFMLVILLVGGGNSVWGDTVLKTIDFSDPSWEGVTFSQGASDDPETINGVTFNAQHDTYHFSWSNGTLTFPETNMSSGNYALGFPVTGIIGGVVYVKVYNGSSYQSFKYTIKDGGTEFKTSDCGSGTSIYSGYVLKTDLVNTNAYIYVGRVGASYQTITKIEVLTPELDDLSESSFYQLYKQSSTTVSLSTLITDANLPSYITMDVTSTNYSSGNSSEVTTPHNFSLDSSKRYYRLKGSSSSKIIIGGLSHVKTIHLYGNGNTTLTRNIKTTVKKLSGDGTAMTVPDVEFENSYQTVKDYSIGDLTALDGYDDNTYYLYTITFTNAFELWGLYIEYNAPSSYTVTYDANGGSGTISNGMGASIDLSNGTGFTAPSGYTFAGWNTDPHGTGTSYASGQTGVEADLTLYAVWTQSGTIDDNGGTADGAYTATYNKAGIEITTAPTNSSYAIKGYYEADTGDDLVATSAGALEASTTYTDEDGYWTHTGSAPTLYAQWNNTHTLTVEVNDDDMGSAEAEETTIAEGSSTEVTAAANSGYKFRSWAVSGTGSSLSSTTDNPTTFTMGTADATVTATFSALEHYTITYNKGENGDGTAIANGDKTEDMSFTLSSSTYTYSGHKQMGWSTKDGGEKAYDLGGTYTDNADLTLYPYWIEQYTLTYDANGGSGSMSAYEGLGSITLAANTYTKAGYTFIGWATSQANANAGTVAYADKAAYTLSANVTLYAVWAESYCEMKVETSGDAPTAGDVVSMQSGAFGGKMTVVSTDGLSYVSNGLQLPYGATTLSVTLNDYMKSGSIISLTLHVSSLAGTQRGFDLYSSDGENKIATLATTESGTNTFQYTVESDDNLDGTTGFQLIKTNNNLVYLKSLTVTDCQPGGVISASGWNTYSSNKKLDLSTLSGGTAYVASSTGGGKVKLTATDGIVAAGTGLMIKGEPGDKFTINTSSSAATLSETNLLVGLPNGGTVTAEAYNYVFGWTDAADPGFYYVNSTEPVLGAGKAYLHVDGGTGARLSINFGDDTPTSINSIDNSQEHNINAYYDLQGRKVKNPTKGLYISNGKKIFVGNKH